MADVPSPAWLLHSRPYHPCPDWEGRHDMVFLGWERNPETGLAYDYWLYDAGEKHATPFRYMALPRHGTAAPEHGTCTLDQFDMTLEWKGDNAYGDYRFGVHRAVHLALVYLAFGRRPLIDNFADNDD